MPRLSIDVTPEQHKTIKAEALLQDKTIKQLLLEPHIPQELNEDCKDNPVQLPDGTWSGAEIDGWSGLKDTLKQRLEQVRLGQFSATTPEQIFEEARERYRDRNEAA